MGICGGTSTEWVFVHGNLNGTRIWKCWFFWRGKPEYPEKTSQSREEEPTLLLVQPTYCVESGNRSRATSVGGECSHHCTIPAPSLLNRELKHVRYWDADGKRKWHVFFYSSSSHHHIYNGKYHFSILDCSLPVVVRVSKTRVLKLPPSFRDSAEKETNVYSVFCFSLLLN